MKNLLIVFLLLASASVSFAQTAGLPLIVRTHPEQGTTWIATHHMKINGDVSVEGDYLKVFKGKTIKGNSIFLTFTTVKSSPIWAKTKFIQLDYGNESIKLVPDYNREGNPNLGLEALTLSVSAERFQRMVRAGKFYATINTVRIPVEGASIKAFQTLLNSDNWPVNQVVKLSSPPKQKLTSRQVQAANSALKSLRKLEAATKVGVTYDKYNDLLVDIKANVDEELRDLPKGALRTEIEKAIASYVSAGVLWQSYARIDSMADGDAHGTDDFLERSWAIAKQHTRQAENLL